MTRQEELDARGRRLRAALAAVLVRADAPELRLIHTWLGSWSGIGLIVIGMAYQGFTVSLGGHGAGADAVAGGAASRLAGDGAG